MPVLATITAVLTPVIFVALLFAVAARVSGKEVEPLSATTALRTE